MGLGHERGDPAHVEVHTARSGAPRQALLDVARHGRLPEAGIGRVNRELARRLGDAHVGVRENPFADFGVERESVRAAAQRQHQHGAGTVERVAGAHLCGAVLQKVHQRRVLPRHGRAQNGENAPHRQIHIDVRRAVERIEEQQILAARKLRGHLVRLGHLLGHHAGQVAAPFGGAEEDVVALQIEWLLRLAMHVVGERLRRLVGLGAAIHAPISARSTQRAQCHAHRDGLARERDIREQRFEVAAMIDRIHTRFDQKLGEGSSSAGGHARGEQ